MIQHGALRAPQPYATEQRAPSTEMLPRTPEDWANELTFQPQVAEAYVQNPETQAYPAIFKGAVAALQRDALINRGSEYLRNNRRAIHDGLVRTGYWQVTLNSVARGNPGAVDLQLATWSLDAARPDLRLVRPSLPRMVAKKTHIDGLTALDPGDQVANDTWRAMRAYALNSPEWGHHFNTEGHPLVMAQVGLMRKLRLFEGMELGTVDPLLTAMIGQGQRFIELSRQDGYLHLLPADARWTMSALEQFQEDQATRARGSRTIGRVQGRTWRFLAEPKAEMAFERYLGSRTELWEHANQRFHEWFAATPDELRNQLQWWMTIARSDTVRVDETETIHSAHDVIDGLYAATYNTNAMEMVGTLWGVLTMRRREPAISNIIDETHTQAKGLLEPYVIDGLHLVSTWQDAHWLPVVTLHSWANEDPRVSVFTAEGKPVIDDRRAAGAALSAQIRLRMGQSTHNSEDGSTSEGYEPLQPHVGMCMALYHVLDLTASKRATRATRPMLLAAYEDFLTMVDRVPKSQQSRVYSGLPVNVQQFMDHRDYLAKHVAVG